MQSNKGNKIPNEFELYTNKGKYFQSYNSVIIFINNKNQIYLDEYYWDYSKTTSKYRNKFLNETNQETNFKIKIGVYKLVDLN